MDRLPITPDKQPSKAEGVAPSTLKVRTYPARPPAIEAITASAKTIPGMSKVPGPGPTPRIDAKMVKLNEQQPLGSSSACSRPCGGICLCLRS